MNLNEFAAKCRLQVFDDLSGGRAPSVGGFDEGLLAECRLKGKPQVGTTRYAPVAIFLEFIYPDPSSTSLVFTVEVDPPERIVFLPVPEWVIENIWQGDVDGSYHFESQAQRLLEGFGAVLDEEANAKWFGPRMAKRRE